MAQPLNYLRETASQTAGPYVHIGLAPGAAGFNLFEKELGTDIAGPNAAGERIRVEGLVTDGTGAPVKDVLIEVWQANAAGIHPRPWTPAPPRSRPASAAGAGSSATSTPGSGPSTRSSPAARRAAAAAPMAPHLNLWIVARGINIGLNTRIYFGDEAEANAADPVLGLVEQAAAAATLIAPRGMRDGRPVYRFDIRLQGEGETVFLDV